MAEHHIEVSRTARYFTLGTPGPGIREVWFVLHGYAQLAEHFIRAFRDLDDGTRLIVAPEALSRFYMAESAGHVGASWMTRVERLHEIDDYLRYLDTLYRRVLAGIEQDGLKVIVLGFSQGAATAARWKVAGGSRIDRLLLWGATLPPEIDLESQREMLGDPILIVGTADEYVTEEQIAGDVQRLERHGVAFRLVRFEGTHQVDAATLADLANAISQ